MNSLRVTTLVTVSALATFGACDDESSPGTSSGSGGAPGECSGVVATGAGPPTSDRRESVQCYVADATTGAPECLPADDPATLLRVSDYISSCGFATEFVIAAAESQPVLAACDELVECCERGTARAARPQALRRRLNRQVIQRIRIFSVRVRHECIRPELLARNRSR